MAKILKVFGASDDLIETSGLPGCDEFNNIPDDKYAGTLSVVSEYGRIEIHAIYSGHWAFAVGAVDGEFTEMPSWKITREWGSDEDYSETLLIECPDDAKLSFSPT